MSASKHTSASAHGVDTSGPTTRVLPDVTIVGAGRAGASIALALAVGGGVGRVHLVCRNADRRASLVPWAMGLPLHIAAAPTAAMHACDLVVFATADRDIRTAAMQWQAGCSGDGHDQIRLHLSGAAVPAALRLDAHTGPVGSCHPLAAIPDPLALPPLVPLATVGAAHASAVGMAARLPTSITSAERDRAARPLRGAFFALAGDDAALQMGRVLALALGGDPHVVPAAHRAAYHGAASVVANDLVALLAIGEQLCSQAELPETAIRPALLHLARTALDAVATASLRPGAALADGLTGAVGRGDAMTLERHLDALADSPDDAEAHRRLSRILLSLVVAGGRLDADRAEAVRKALA